MGHTPDRVRFIAKGQQKVTQTVQDKHPQTGNLAVADLSAAQAKAELAWLAVAIEQANIAYHRDDAPDLSDAAYDALKRRNAAIEAQFPALKRADSPSEVVGAAVAEGFGKVAHAVRMLSLGNAFDDNDVLDFDQSIRKYLGLGDDAPLS